MKRRNRWLVLILAICPLVVAAGVFMGRGFAHPSGLFEPAQRGILQIRLWRVALGAIVGASLSVAGAVLQAVLRNPLAEPYLLGISSGAGLGAAVFIIAAVVPFSTFALPASGFVGAVLSLIIVYRLALVGRRTSSHTLILAGVVWSSLCGSLLMFLVSQSSAEGLHALLWWFLGDLQVFDAHLVLAAALVIGLALLALSFLAREMNVLMLGEEMAGHIGLNPERVKMLLLALASAITASAVCVSGLIGFVGLTVPHAARALVGPDHRRLLPAAAFLGAAFLVLADGIGRTVLAPVEIPVGVVTAFLGGPFFLVLLRRRQREIWL